MNTNEKICIWLGKSPEVLRSWNVTLDFLHDRNQQKWIEDKLRKEGWEIDTHITPISAWVLIYKMIKGLYTKYESTTGELNTAFIQAVEQLIDKEDAL